MASIGMPLHLRLKTREHYCTLLDARLLREVRRWFPRRGDPAAPAARAGRTSLEGRWPEGDSVLFAPWTPVAAGLGHRCYPFELRVTLRRYRRAWLQNLHPLWGRHGRRHEIRTLGPLRVFGGALLVVVGIVGAFLAMLGAMALLAKGDERRVRRVMRVGVLKSYNDTMRKFAGRRHFPFALLTHVGRRSGRTHQTPLGAIIYGDGFVLPLAWGRQVDWCQNVRATGTCRLRWKGQIYDLERPEIISALDVARVWPPWKRMMMRLLRIEDFLWLHDRIPRPGTAAGHGQAARPA